ncbi:hypothetical protein OSTOST_06545, partial [Ostertagia ostertagi]
MEKRGLTKEVNIILTSDHGNEQRVKFGHNMIYTDTQALAREVYNNLSNAVDETLLKIRVFTKHGFPNDHFYKGMSSRIGDVILEPDIGYDVDFTCTRKQLDKLYDYGRIKLNKASHGQDPKNSEMLAMLVIGGPDVVKPQRVGRTAHIIDLYPLMCHLLDIPAAPNNGTFSRIASTFYLKNYRHG